MSEKKNLDIDKLKYLYEETDNTLREIATQLGCSLSLIVRNARIHKLNKFNKYGFINKELLSDLYITQQLSMSEIAELLGVQKHVIQSRVEKYELHYNKYKYTYLIEKEDLEKLIEEGYNLTQIAKEFNCSVPVICNKLKEYDIKYNKRKYNINKDELYEMYVVQNKSISHIAQHYGCSNSIIQIRLKELNLRDEKGKDRLSIDNDKLKEYIAQGLTYDEIAKLMDLSVSSVANRSRRLKLSKPLSKIHNVTKDELYNLYVVQGKSQTDIGKLYNCSNSSVQRRLAELGINKPNKEEYISKDELYDLYINKNMSIRNIHKLTGMGERTIVKYLDIYNISKTPKYPNVSVDVVRELYVDKNLNTPEIAELLECPKDHISNIVHRYNLVSERTPEAHKESIDRSYAKVALLSRSKGESEIEDIFNTEFKNIRTVLPLGLELDLYYPEKNVAIEYNGDYWHSTKCNKGQLHITKMTLCKNKGIRLINIFERFWRNKTEQPKIINLLYNALLPNQLNAIEGNVRTISKDTAKKFIEINCLSKFKTAKIYLGLFNKDELISVMSLKDNKIVNYSIKVGYIEDYNILINYIIKNYRPKYIEVECDRRFYDGSLFEDLGFQIVKITKADYSYIGHNKECSKREYNKNPDKYKCYNKVFDCGKLILIYYCTTI